MSRAVLVLSSDGTYWTKTTIASAVSSADTVGKTIVITTPQTINDVTIPSTIALRCEKSGVITVNSGKTLTINGPFSAGSYQCFAGSGAVVFGANSTSFAIPEWWGAKADGVTDSTAAINSSLASGAKRTQLSAGSYTISGQIFVGTAQLTGNGISTILKSTATADTIRLGSSALSSSMVTGGIVENLRVDIYGSSSTAIYLLQSTNASVRNVQVYSQAARPNSQIGVLIDGGNISAFFNQFTNVYVQGVDQGFVFNSSGSGYATSSTFVNCSALTYTDNTLGIGVRFNGSNGQDSIFIGGNMESCKKGIVMDSGTWAVTRTQGTTWLGMRFEANSVCDIDWGNGGFRNTFTGYGNYANSSAAGSLNYDATKGNSINGANSGTWTPEFTSTGASFAYTTQLGNYSISGDIVTATISITTSGAATGTLTNPITVNLPIATKDVTGQTYSAVVGYSTRSSKTIVGYATANSKAINLFIDGNTSATPTNIGLGAGGSTTVITITYLL